MENMTKQELLNAIQVVNFAIIDLGLYLDTHPDCDCALHTYHDKKAEYERMVCFYEKKYGPLTIYGVENDRQWDWVDGPWPWQKGCDC